MEELEEKPAPSTIPSPPPDDVIELPSIEWMIENNRRDNGEE
jgi:hypothetical protein